MSWCSAGEYSGNSENAKAVINATFYEVSDNSPFLRKDFEFQLTELSHTSPPSTSTASFCGGSTTHHKYSVEFDIPASVDLYTPMTATVNMVDECQTGPAESEVSYTLNMAPAWFTSNDPNARVAIVLQGNMAGTSVLLSRSEPLKNCDCEIQQYEIFMKEGTNAMQTTGQIVTALNALIRGLTLGAV